MSDIESAINRFRKRTKDVVVEDIFYAQVFYSPNQNIAGEDSEVLSLSVNKFNFDYPSFEYEELNSGFSSRPVLKDIKINNSFSLDFNDLCNETGISNVIIGYLSRLIREQNYVKTSRVVNYQAQTNTHIEPLFRKVIVTKFLDILLKAEGPYIKYVFNNCYIDGKINQEILDYNRGGQLSKFDLKFKFDSGEISWVNQSGNSVVVENTFKF